MSGEALTRRGEVWTANFNPARGSEIGKIRPALVLLANELLSAPSPTVIVLPLTTRIDERLERIRLTIRKRDRLESDSQVIIDQPRTLDRRRIGDGPLTELSVEEMAHVERNLLAILGVRGWNA